MPKKIKKTKGKSASDRSDLPPLPDRRAIEGMMAGLFGGSTAGEDKNFEAQDMVYQAWEEADWKRRVALARQALEIDPDCADAYVLLAEEETATEAARDLYAQGVAAGERSLGRKFFKEEAGHFWGILETRPYMRARAGLAQCLRDLGEKEAAVAHYQEMLRLNPNDNQGIRDLLATCLLDLGRDDDLDRLLRQYEDDASAGWAYARALLAFRRRGDTEEARKALWEAIKTNRHVPAYLLGKCRLPRTLPDLYGMGSEEEAILYAAHNLAVWKRTPGALEWLARAGKR